jgi:hypothetical protein
LAPRSFIRNKVVAKGEDSFIGRQEQRLAGAAGQELYLRVGLAMIDLKAQR